MSDAGQGEVFGFLNKYVVCKQSGQSGNMYIFESTVEETARYLWQASEKRHSCRITMKGEPLSRVVHPYGICRTSVNRIVLVCWQSMGFTKAGGKAGYRNLMLENIAHVEILETRFQKRPDFNPDDGQYKDWVYHI